MLLKMHSTRCTLQNMLVVLTSVVTMVADMLKVTVVMIGFLEDYLHKTTQ